MMKQLMILCLLFSTIHLLANDKHKEIQVTGKFIKCEWGVTKEIRNILFLKERANLRIPDKKFLFQLNESSAQRIGKDKIWVIPVNEFQFNKSILYNYEEGYSMYPNQDKEITIIISPVSDLNNYLFYSNDNALLSVDALKQIRQKRQFWQRPHKGDTIASHLFSVENDFRNTLLKIRQLGKGTPVVHANETRLHVIDNLNNRQYDTIKTYYDRQLVKEVALGELIQLKWMDDFQPPKDIKTKKEWMAWYNSLPQPVFDKPDISVPIIQIPYSDDNVDGFSSRMFQNRRNQLIYSLSSREGYVLDTQKDIVIKIDSTLSSYFNDPSSVEKDYYAEFSSIQIEDDWFNEKEEVYQSEAIELMNGDIVIASIQSNKFQLKFYLYKKTKGSNKPDKGILFHCMLPLEKYYSVGLFEAYGKYYFVYNTISSTHASIAVIEDSMFRNVAWKE